MSCTKSYPILSCFKSADGLTTIPVFRYVLQGSNGESLGQGYSLTDSTQTLIDITTYNGGGKVTIGECPKPVIYEKEICGLINGLTYELTKVYSRDNSGVMTLLHYEDSKGIVVSVVEEVCCPCNAICGSPSAVDLPIVTNDVSTYTPGIASNPITILSNDTTGDVIVPSTIKLTLTGTPTGTLSVDSKTLTVPGEGTWTISPTGTAVFTPIAGYTGSPTPVTYIGQDAQGNASNEATITLIADPLPVTSFNADTYTPSIPKTIDVLANDTTGDLIVPSTVDIIGADAGTGGNTKTVPGEGVWTVNPITGTITFTPEAGFVGSPTPISYTGQDAQGNVSNPSTVTLTADPLPTANNDTVNITNVTQPTTINILANDNTGDTIVPSSIILTTTGVPGSTLSLDGKTLTVPGQGTWIVNPGDSLTFTPQVGFVGSPTPVTYQGADAQGNVDTATVTLIAPTNPPVANNDIITGLTAGSVANISILGNDLTSSGAVATTSNTTVALTTTGLPAGSTLNGDGTVTVPGEGTWSYTNGVLSFTPQAGFTGDPTPITYTLTDNTTGLTDAATVVADYNQAPVVVSTGIMRWEHNDNGGTSYAGTENVNCASSLTNISFGSGLTLLNDVGVATTIPNGSTYEHILTGVAETTFAGAKTANDYVQVGFIVTGNSQISNIFHGLVPRAWGGTGAGGYQVAAEISNDNFVTFTTLYSNATLPIPGGGYVANSQAVIYPMTTGSYTIRFYLYNEQNNATLNNGGALPNNTVAFDDLQITVDCLQ